MLNLWQENETLPMIIQMQIIMQQMKLPAIKKFQYLVFVTATMLTL